VFEGVVQRIESSMPLGFIMVVLIVASNSDIASMTLYHSMLRLEGWSSPSNCTVGEHRTHESGLVNLLLIDILHIRADNIDVDYMESTGVSVEGVLILSRHVSSSETPAMTLHAIGIPGILPFGEIGISGGLNGVLVPPNPFFAPLFRTMTKFAKERKIDDEFDLTLETTHHGPVLNTPTLYIEIGSTEKEWIRDDVADCWAETISHVLGLFTAEKPYIDNNLDVMIGFGGGHYAPRHKAVILESNINLGHVIANYSLSFDDFDESKNPSGPWISSVVAAVESTKISFPNSNIFAHLDRKSFKGWQRSAIIQKLGELGIEVRRGKEILQRE
jgi:D-aminoacyl-tRNA deacylase